MYAPKNLTASNRSELLRLLLHLCSKNGRKVQVVFKSQLLQVGIPDTEVDKGHFRLSFGGGESNIFSYSDIHSIALFE